MESNAAQKKRAFAPLWHSLNGEWERGEREGERRDSKAQEKEPNGEFEHHKTGWLKDFQQKSFKN